MLENRSLALLLCFHTYFVITQGTQCQQQQEQRCRESDEVSNVLITQNRDYYYEFI